MMKVMIGKHKIITHYRHVHHMESSNVRRGNYPNEKYQYYKKRLYVILFISVVLTYPKNIERVKTVMTLVLGNAR